MKILVADDDLELLRLIAFALRQAGYLIVEAQDGPSALSTFEAERPDLVILDVNMPRLDGFEVLKRIRSGGATTPVLMLTVRATEEDQVRGLDLGADDYLTKPFSPRTLLARVRALLRRSGGGERPGSLAAGQVALDAERSEVRLRGGEPVRLTNLEFRLLHLLMSRPGYVFPSEDIIQTVWGSQRENDQSLLKNMIYRLRKKLEEEAGETNLIQTWPGGYSFQED